jgi:hypothetical protein
VGADEVTVGVPAWVDGVPGTLEWHPANRVPVPSSTATDVRTPMVANPTQVSRGS